jgi:hypothetical protein
VAAHARPLEVLAESFAVRAHALRF